MATALHTVVEMALRRQQPGTGSSRTLLAERTAMYQWPRLSFLEPLFAVMGAVGMRLYAPERATRDLDVIVARRDAAEAERRLLEIGREQVGKLALPGWSWRSADDQELDLFVGEEDWWPALIAEAQSNRDKQELPVLPLRGQVWLKLQAARTIDAGDLSRLLGLASDEQVAEARQFLQAIADKRDLQDFDSLVTLGRLEFGEQQ